MSDFEEGSCLREVFDLCQPRKSDRKISLGILQSLLQDHARTQGYPELGLSPPGHLEVDVWISFEEFKTGISELFFFNDKKPSGAPAENEGEELSGERKLDTPRPTWTIDKKPSVEEISAGELVSPEQQQHLLDAPIPTANGSIFADFVEQRRKSFCEEGEEVEKSTNLDHLLASGSNSVVSSLPNSGAPSLSSNSTVMSSNNADGANAEIAGDSSTKRHFSPAESFGDSSGDPCPMSPDDDDDDEDEILHIRRNNRDEKPRNLDGVMLQQEEESFDGYGANEDVEYDDEDESRGEDDLDGVKALKGSSPDLPERNFVRRNSWMRTSLRRPPGGNNRENVVPQRRWGSFRHSNKRVGSHAIASQLYHNGSASFNSSGRSSNCDDGDMQSDISIEEDVNDLNQKKQQMSVDSPLPPRFRPGSKAPEYLLQWQQSQVKCDEDLLDEVQTLTEKVGALTESQALTDDKYSKVKKENELLRTKINDLEEEVRELQIASGEQEELEQKRTREMIARVEREKQLELENCAIRYQSLEKEHVHLQTESAQLRAELDRVKAEKRSTEKLLTETQESLTLLREENEQLSERFKRGQQAGEQERTEQQQIIEELSREVEMLRPQIAQKRTSPLLTVSSIEDDSNPDGLGSRISELEAEVRTLRQESKALASENVDLRGQVLQYGVDQGKRLLLSGGSSVLDPSNPAAMMSGDSHHGATSIGTEIREMTDEQERNLTKAELEEIRAKLKEQKEVNDQLRHYIDSILMNIMEKYPELLEVRK